MLGSQFSFFIRFAFFIETNLVRLYKLFKAIDYYSNVVSMKQSRDFKFIAFRDLTPVRAGATPQRMFEKWDRHGETDV